MWLCLDYLPQPNELLLLSQSMLTLELLANGLTRGPPRAWCPASPSSFCDVKEQNVSNGKWIEIRAKYCPVVFGFVRDVRCSWRCMADLWMNELLASLLMFISGVLPRRPGSTQQLGQVESVQVYLYWGVGRNVPVFTISKCFFEFPVKMSQFVPQSFVLLVKNILTIRGHWTLVQLSQCVLWFLQYLHK